MKWTTRASAACLTVLLVLMVSREAFAIPTGTMGIRAYNVNGTQLAVELRVERIDGPYLIEPIDITSEIVGPHWVAVPAQTYAIYALGNTGEPYPGPPLGVVPVGAGANDILVNLIAPTPCATDVNDDRTTNFADVLAVLADWGGCHLCASDVNDDAIVNFADILALLAEWGACPE